jgi:MFS family permease
MGHRATGDRTTVNSGIGIGILILGMALAGVVGYYLTPVLYWALVGFFAVGIVLGVAVVLILYAQGVWLALRREVDVGCGIYCAGLLALGIGLLLVRVIQ